MKSTQCKNAFICDKHCVFFQNSRILTQGLVDNLVVVDGAMVVVVVLVVVTVAVVGARRSQVQSFTSAPLVTLHL
jgi:hypothetical protein